MVELINCPVCGEENAAVMENCVNCRQPLRQSTSELHGGGELISSGDMPTEKQTAELEHTLPAWLRNARQGGQEEEDQPAPAPPAPKAPPKPEPKPQPKPEPKEEVENDDWLAGLNAAEDDEEDGAADWLMNLSGFTPDEDEKEETFPDIPSFEAEAVPAPPAISEADEPIQTGSLPEWLSEGDAQENAAPEAAHAD